jgi:TonB family protein
VAPIPKLTLPQESVEGRVKAEPVRRDTLKDLELPPEAPRLGKLKPVEETMPGPRPDPAKSSLERMLNQLPVPSPAQATKAPDATPEPTRKPSLADQAAQQLAKASVLPPPRPLPSSPAPPSTASATTPDVTMRVTGAGPGSNPYLALVQNLISRQWVAPPVDVSGRRYRAVVRFRLDRTGAVSGVTIELSSGNGYYDDAAKRAVLRATLPEFPADMPAPYLDTHFSFAVGEEVG